MKSIFRLLQIIRVIIRYRLSDLLLDLIKLPALKPLVYLTPWRYLPSTKKSQALRIRLALEDLGAIFIKFGQTLSTRRDLLPADVGDELSKLQDTCPPFDGELAAQMIEDSLGKKLDEVFAYFDKKPLASASIAQVHSAKTLSGEEVVVKVLRPNIKAHIKRDLALLANIAKLIHRQKPLLRAPEAVAELARILHNELDMLQEAANTDKLRRNFADSQLLYVPKVYWHLTTKQVLVSERIYGTPINDIATLKAKGVNLKTLAENGVIIFFKQVFEHNFFHADMHPGNIFVSDSGRYNGVDFGIMGTLPKADLHHLSESFLGFFSGDYKRIAKAYLQVGYISDNIDLNAFENSIASVCIPLLEKPLSEISFGRVLLSLLEEAKHFKIEIQPQLLLLDKTLLNIEGLGRQLYPDLDLWATAKPFLEDLAKQKYKPQALYQNLKQYVPEWLATLPKFPQMSKTLLKELTNNNHNQKKQIHQLAQLQQSLNQQKRHNKLLLLLIIAIVALLFN